MDIANVKIVQAFAAEGRMAAVRPMQHGRLNTDMVVA
jgi:hypothetical protein